MSTFSKLRIWYANTIDRLARESGETLTETLVSILIGTLALIMLAGAITTATNIVVSSKRKMDEHYTAEDLVVAGDSTKIVGSDFKVELTETGAANVALLADGITVYSENADNANATARYTK